MLLSSDMTNQNAALKLQLTLPNYDSVTGKDIGCEILANFSLLELIKQNCFGSRLLCLPVEQSSNNHNVCLFINWANIPDIMNFISQKPHLPFH